MLAISSQGLTGYDDKAIVRLYPDSFSDLRPGVPTGNPMAAWDGNPSTYADQWEASWGGVTYRFDHPVVVVRLNVLTRNESGYSLCGKGHNFTVSATPTKNTRIWQEGDFVPFQTDYFAISTASGVRARIFEIELFGYYA